MKRDWLREPIVVLPAAAALLFFLCLPVAVFGLQGAPQFYGAFFAALTGLGSVLAGALYNAQLTRRRDDRLERIKVLAAARVARSELSHAHERLRNRNDWFRKRIIPDAKNREVVLDEYTRYLLVSVNKELATPETDKHVLELCQQSEAIANALLNFLRLRAAQTDEVDDFMRQIIAGEQPERLHLFVWDTLTVNLDLMDEELSLLIAGLKAFLDAHAGEFA